MTIEQFRERMLALTSMAGKVEGYAALAVLKEIADLAIQYLNENNRG